MKTDIAEYCRKHAIMSKLKAALEQIEVGNGYSIFEGLQNGPITLTVIADEETVHFEAMPKVVLTVLAPSDIPPSLPIPEETEKPRRKVKQHEDT